MSHTDKTIIYFVGPSNSGKTTTIEKIIQSLQDDGIKCGTIKFIHHPTLTLDPAGKDSSRHRSAGALFTLNFAPKETAVIIKRDQRDTIERAKTIISSSGGILPDVDIILCESLNHPPPKSLVFLSANSYDEIDKYYKELVDCNVLGVIGTITNSKEAHKEFNSFQLFSALVTKDLVQIVDLIKNDRFN